jgi:hypothetical protein
LSTSNCDQAVRREEYASTPSLAAFIAINILVCAYILIEIFDWVFKLGSLQTL